MGTCSVLVMTPPLIHIAVHNMGVTAKFPSKVLYAVGCCNLFSQTRRGAAHDYLKEEKSRKPLQTHTFTHTNVTEITSTPWLQKNISGLNLGGCCYLITETTM